MAQTGIPLPADNLGSYRTQRVVSLFLNRPLLPRLIITRPTRTRFELGSRIKQLLPTTPTQINTLLAMIPVQPGKGSLCSFLSGDFILKFYELRFPLPL